MTRYFCTRVGDLKRERSAEHKSGCVALYCIFEGYCDELPSCTVGGQTSNKNALKMQEGDTLAYNLSGESARGLWAQIDQKF